MSQLFAYRQLKEGRTRLVILLLGFSFAYALLEYYAIRDPSFGYDPILFSLIYPYHLLMATAIGIFSYWLLRFAGGVDRRVGPPAVVSATTMLFVLIITLEDFLWFVLRAVAPYQGDINAGRLIIPGEWTTQFLGSTDLYLTAIPNWYFVSVLLAAAYFSIIRVHKKSPPEKPSLNVMQGKNQR